MPPQGVLPRPTSPTTRSRSTGAGPLRSSRAERAGATCLPMRSTLCLLVVSLSPVAQAADSVDWNDKAIAWKEYEAGLKQAAAEKRPVCLVFWAGWCPHCRNYAKVFSDPKVVELSKKLVMIRVDSDAAPAVSSKYVGDGEYVPRTFFLTPSGKLSDLNTGAKQFRYFYDESSPGPLAAAMQKALGLK